MRHRLLWGLCLEVSHQQIRELDMANHTGQQIDVVEWKTSHTFLADIYSGDQTRLNSAFKRIIDELLPWILAQIRKALPAHQQSLVEDVANNLLVRLLKRLQKGWRHSPGTRFGECMMRMAKDAVSESKRSLRRRQEVDLNEAIVENLCTEIAEVFCRTEILQAAESKVQAEARPDHWQVYVEWKTRKGMISEPMLPESAQADEQRPPLTDNDRKIVERIRSAVRNEIERIAKRGGFQPEDLFGNGP